MLLHGKFTMKKYVVTGASSGIGKAICEALLKENNKVYGIGRNFGDFSHENLVKIELDLRDAYAVENIKNKIDERIYGLVNAAGVAYYGTHETITPEQIGEMVDVNVKAPMILTKLFLPNLRETKGIIINVSSVTAKMRNNTHGVCYGATKAALTSFSQSLFEEVRKQGVRVTTIHPDLTDTRLYRNADFRPTGDSFETLFAEDIAKEVMHVLCARDGICIEDITIRPQRFGLSKKNRAE